MSRFSFLTLIFFCLSCFISLSHALNNGFSVELIHRDSSKSPLYHPTETKFQRISNAVRRSINRAHHFNKEFSLTVNKPVSTLTPDSAEYLMSYSVGTPPVKVYGTIDTGSNLVWLQCKPCDICVNQTSPMFNPSKSSSYNNIRCSSRKCKSTRDIYTSCSYDKEGVCEYTATYGRGIKSRGDLIVETLTFDSTTSNSSVSFPKIVIGCGHTNILYGGQSTGVVGLGSGHLSLTKQLGSSIGGKFSYCLIPYFGEFSDQIQSNSSGKLSFGDAAVVSGESVVSTPIAKLKGLGKDYYFLTLEAFSVGNKRIEYGGSKFEGINISTRNILIDSGTPMTTLPQHFHTSLESAVAEVVKLERVEDHKYNHSFSLCYNTTLKQSNFPVITAHFSGADIKLYSNSTFVPIDDGIMCFAFLPSQGFAFFGNFAQHNLLVGYDLEKNTLSFKPTDCTKH